MSALRARIRTGATLAVAAVGLLWLDTHVARGRLALAVVTLLALLSAWELDRMGTFRGRRLGPSLYVAALLCALATGYDVYAAEHVPAVPALVLLYACAGLSAWPWLLHRWLLSSTGSIEVVGAGERVPVVREVVPLALWLLPPLFALVLVDRDFGVPGTVALIALAKIGDNAGFFVGRAIGKRRPFPRISPGKTVAGCVASLAAGVAGGAVILPLTLGELSAREVALGALIGAAINVAAQAGDLSESWVKRRAGVKDSSALLGPSGGVLDVIDSLFLAAPVALLLWTWVYDPAAG